MDFVGGNCVMLSCMMCVQRRDAECAEKDLRKIREELPPPVSDFCGVGGAQEAEHGDYA